MVDWPKVAKQAVYADKAYESKERRKQFRERCINDRIMHRWRMNQERPLHNFPTSRAIAGSAAERRLS